MSGCRDPACFPAGAGVVVGGQPGVRDTSPIESRRRVWRSEYLRAVPADDKEGFEDGDDLPGLA